MAQITSREELEEWLKDKPTDWGQVIAARAALRVLPDGFGAYVSDDAVAKHSLALFRATAISWAARNFPAYDISKAADAAAYAAYAASRANYADPGSSEAYADASRAARAAADVGDFRVGYVVSPPLWSNLSADCDWLENAGDPALASRFLTREPLWPGGESGGWSEAWVSATGRLAALNLGYSVWVDWYDRRVKGKCAAFDIPGDTDRIEDKKILARLADATDEDFWSKGATYVNTTLQSWIDEARERVKPPPPQDVTVAEPRPQNPDALVWQSDADNRIGVDAQSGVDALDVSDEARDRHHEARDEAQRVRALCGTSDAAFEIGGLLDRYLEAMGERIEGVRPGLFVQRGERLRQALASRIADGTASNYGPLPDQVRDGLRGWQSAHNAFVGLDAKLARIDSALYGPDARHNIVPPDDIRAIANSADEAEILQPGGRDALEGAAAIAPTPPDADDRRSRLSSETVKNFGRKVLSVLWFGMKGGTVFYGLGHWIVANAGWFRKWFADDPPTLAVVERILDFLSKLPLT